MSKMKTKLPNLKNERAKCFSDTDEIFFDLHGLIHHSISNFKFNLFNFFSERR